MRSTLCLLIVTISLVNAGKKPECESLCGGHCTYSESQCDNENGEFHTYSCSCEGDSNGNDICCATETSCEARCGGFCVENADQCPSPKRIYTGPSCSCDGARSGDKCCADVCETMDADDPCVSIYHGACLAVDKCPVGGQARIENGLCDDGCICCKPKCRPGHGGSGIRADPYYITMDNNTFHYEGKCTYIAMRSCEDPLKDPWFTVYVEHTGDKVFYLGKEKTYVKGAIIEINTKDGGKHIIHFMSHGHVKINDDDAIAIDDFEGWQDSSMGLHVQKLNQRLFLTLDGHFTVSYNRKENVFVELGELLAGKVCGLMGNGDGDPKNDFAMYDPSQPSGLKILNNPTQEEIDLFGDSWVKPRSCPEEE